MTALPISSSPTYLGGSLQLKPIFSFIKEHAEIVFFVFIFMCVIGNSAIEKNEREKVFASPQKHDFFYIDYRTIDPSSDARFRYVPMKLISINNDSYTFKVGNIAHTTPVSPRQHAKFDKALLMRNYYRADALVMSKERLHRLVSSGAIYDARRPRNIYINGWMVLHVSELEAN